MEITFEALGYRQGSRPMYVFIGDFPSANQLIKPGDTWNPANPQGNSNRPRDKAHKEGIKQYLLREADPIIGAITLYVDPADIRSEGVEGFSHFTKLAMRVGAWIEINDGQHRLAGGIEAADAATQLSPEVWERLRSMGVPMIVVPEARPLKKAQDYADLQTNVKPPTGSLAASMNRRVPANAFILDRVALNPSIHLMTTGDEAGDRVSFLKDSVGKGDQVKWVSFKTLHAFVGVLLAGGKIRSKPIMTRTLNNMVSGSNADDVAKDVADFLNAFALANPWLSEVIAGNQGMDVVYDQTLLRSSGALYAVAHAGNMLHGAGLDWAEAGKRLGALNYDRPDACGLFLGNLVSPDTGKIGAGREGWLAGGNALAAASAPKPAAAKPAPAKRTAKKSAA